MQAHTGHTHSLMRTNMPVSHHLSAYTDIRTEESFHQYQYKLYV